MKSLEWMGDALCAQTNPDLFFPEGTGSTTREAKKICAACPVQPQCNEHAAGLEGDLSARYRYGAWGGMSPTQRAEQGGIARSAERDRLIIRLTEQGWTAAEVGLRVGCTSRTVGRVRAANRQQEAAA